MYLKFFSVIETHKNNDLRILKHLKIKIFPKYYHKLTQ
jgi:hypothetical protein